VTNKKTNKHTNNKQTSNFSLNGSVRKSEPHQTWHGDRGGPRDTPLQGFICRLGSNMAWRSRLQVDSSTPSFTPSMQRLTLHGGPVWLRPVRATPCSLWNWGICALAKQHETRWLYCLE